MKSDVMMIIFAINGIILFPLYRCYETNEEVSMQYDILFNKTIEQNFNISFERTNITAIIQNIHPFVTYDNKIFSLTRNAIKYENISITFLFNMNIINNFWRKEAMAINFYKKYLTVTLNYSDISLLRISEENFEINYITFKGIEVNLGDLEQFAIFSEFYESNYLKLKKMFEYIWEYRLKDIMNLCPKPNILEKWKLLTTFMEQWMTTIEHVPGVKSAQIRNVHYETFKKIDTNCGRFQNVSLELIYSLNQKNMVISVTIGEIRIYIDELEFENFSIDNNTEKEIIRQVFQQTLKTLVLSY